MDMDRNELKLNRKESLKRCLSAAGFYKSRIIKVRTKRDDLEGRKIAQATPNICFNLRFGLGAV